MADAGTKSHPKSPSKIAKIVRRDILGLKRYVPARDDIRRRAMEVKRPRRAEVGDRVTLVFENRDTLCFQIEEMLRAESIVDDDKIQDEIDVYNAIMPDAGSLSATLFLSVFEGEDAKPTLHRFVGLDEHLTLEIGSHRLRAAFEPGRKEGDRISAVQYVRFPLDEAAKQTLRTPGARLALAIDHPNYRHRSELAEATRAALAADYD
jgi:uncharacterized protein DUF3501